MQKKYIVITKEGNQFEVCAFNLPEAKQTASFNARRMGEKVERVFMKKEYRGGAGRGQGRKSREELGLEEVKNTTVQVEPSVIEACKQKHGSLANALRFAASAK